MAVAKSGERAASAAGLDLWRLVRRWVRHADAELAPVGLTLVQWAILEETHGLILDAGDAVSQAAIAQRMEMDKMTLSHAMRTLDGRGLVDRGPNLVGPAYRIWVTSWGQRVRQQGAAKVEAAALEVFGPRDLLARGLALLGQSAKASPCFARRDGGG